MKNGLVMVFMGLSVGFSALAQSSSQSPLMRDFLKSEGRLVFLADDFVPGQLDDGTGTFDRFVIYQGSHRNLDNDPTRPTPDNFKMACTVEYNTTVDFQHETPGQDISIKAGKQISYLNGEFLKTYLLEDLENGFFSEEFIVKFFDSPVDSVSCNILLRKNVATMTVKDFEAATGGRLSFKAGPP